MRSYVPWICAGCMLCGLVGAVSWGVKKALSPPTASTQSPEAGKNRLSLLPYKIIGNYEIAKPEGEASGATARE